MKRIGILGGLGPESTLDYYKEIILAFNTHYQEFAYPEIIIYSANLNEFMGIVDSQNWSFLVKWLLEKISHLHHADAEFVAIASNTPHIVFDELQQQSPIPILSIVNATCTKAQEMGAKNIGLLGTKLTMESEFYKRPFIDNGISIVVPETSEQDFIHQKLFSEIEKGIFKDSTRNELLDIIENMVKEKGIDSVILGCTELPLILPESKFGIPFLNTSAIHCESIVQYCLHDS